VTSVQDPQHHVVKMQSLCAELGLRLVSVRPMRSRDDRDVDLVVVEFDRRRDARELSRVVDLSDRAGFGASWAPPAALSRPWGLLVPGPLTLTIPYVDLPELTRCLALRILEVNR
jgi:hypothetical protein